MRRGLTAVIGTVAGTALLVGAKLGSFASDPTAAGPAIEAGVNSSASPLATGQPSPTPKARASTASTKPAPRQSATAPKPGGLRSGTFAGPAVSERFGVIKVTVVVAGGRITDVSASCSCSGRSRSISDSAFATLEPRVLTAQSANVQSVSGATYTYQAYKQSLGAAISTAKA